MNRLAKEKKTKNPERLSFQPATLEKSNQLADRHRERMLTEINDFVENQNVKINANEEMKIEDLFIADYMKRKLSNENKKREKENQQLQECSFRPKINKTSSTGYGRPNKMSVKIISKMGKRSQNPLQNSNRYTNELENTFSSIDKENRHMGSQKNLSASKRFHPQGPPPKV